MFIKQLSIFAENRNGAIMEITSALKENNINIRALSIADTTDFGIVRLIVDKTELAYKALKDCGMTVAQTDVIAISIGDAPGSFHEALVALYGGEIMIEYSYAFATPVDAGATVILRCREQEKAVKLIRAHGLRILSQDEVSA